MNNLTRHLTDAVESAEKVLGIAVKNWLFTQEGFPEHEKALYIASQTVELAHINCNSLKAVQGIMLGLMNQSEEGNKFLSEAYEAIDYLFQEHPNDRLDVTRNLLCDGMTAVNEKDIAKAQDVMGTLGEISDTVRGSLLEHLSALETELGMGDVH
ncbi:hypothetical protein [Evansella clarkii]|uniref:hypothetical protein n=1 Tax=Evansella clarkii TaxID=79879 RepID=UPI000B43F62B|nr:hypothetical protein [Evansella clarkii]